MSITDYVVFDQGSLYQTLIQATQSVATATRAPVERVAERLRVAFLSQPSQCQPSLISVNTSGVWIASGRNEFHVAKGSLIGMTHGKHGGLEQKYALLLTEDLVWKCHYFIVMLMLTS